MIINHDFGVENSNKNHNNKVDDKASQTLGLVLYVGIAHSTDNMAFCVETSDFMKMDKNSFDNLAPRLVLTPLVAGGLDVLDFAKKLQLLEFKGRFQAVVQKIPDAMIITNEVKAVAPNVNFTVTELVWT
jgi:hypothetical protein